MSTQAVQNNGNIVYVRGGATSVPTSLATKPETTSGSRILHAQPEKDMFETGVVSKSKGITVQIDEEAKVPERFLDETVVNKMLAANPRAGEIFTSVGVKPTVCVDNVRELSAEHIATTVKLTQMLADELGMSSEDKRILAQTAVFHDYGKILIPESVLKKEDKLSPREKQITDLHARAGYELLKTQIPDKKVLYSVLNHHVPSNMLSDERTKVLSVADVYSALTEERPYKKAYSPEKAFEIMDEDVKAGKLDGNIVNALKHCVAEKAAA